MKKSIILVLIAILVQPMYSQIVEQSVAQKVALNLYREQYSPNANNVIKSILTISTDSCANAFHVAEYINGGFSIIAGDRAAPPVLGFCENGNYNTDELPQGLLFLLSRYEAEIKELRKKTDGTTRRSGQQSYESQWDYYLNDDSGNQLRSYKSDDYLLSTTWSQRNGFNKFCPEPDDNPAGCTAVAMAQILCYWNCRVQPQGTHSYRWKKGNQTLEANFGNTRYYWAK